MRVYQIRKFDNHIELTIGFLNLSTHYDRPLRQRHAATFRGGKSFKTEILQPYLRYSILHSRLMKEAARWRDLLVCVLCRCILR